MKGKKSKKVTDDDWDFLVNGEDGDDDMDEEDVVQSNGKRKRGGVSGKSAADDEWLESKRKKAKGVEKKGKGKTEVKAKIESESEDDDDEDEIEATGDDMDGLQNPFSDDEMSADDFDEYEDSEDEEDEEDQPPPKKRENPYIAPVTASSTPPTKYIPPSLRQPSTSDEEVLKQLRRQIQGQLNRLSEANLPSILTAVLDLYNSNARQHCTSVLVSLLTNLISDPSVLTDTFLILHAGFSAALYRSLGPDFGAQLLESLVQSFDTHHSSPEEGKQPLNITKPSKRKKPKARIHRSLSRLRMPSNPAFRNMSQVNDTIATPR
jgi:nucleolar MIF4G domain-containing protein 1